MSSASQKMTRFFQQMIDQKRWEKTHPSNIIVRVAV